MSVAQRDESVDDGQPIRCYEFARGPLRWLYTDVDRDVERNSKIFRAGYQASDSGIENSGNSQTDALVVSLNADSEISQMFRVMAPSDPIKLTIWDTHFGEEQALVSWVGTIQNVRWPTLHTCEISCTSIAASLDLPGLTLGWQRSCPYTLYDKNCRVNNQAHKLTGIVHTASGVTATMQEVASFPNHWFSGGYIEWGISGGVVERRGVRQQIGDTLLLLGSAHGIPAGQVVAIYPGCYRTTEVCDIKFNNMPNYGGHPHLPGRSPFDGNPVF